MKKIIALLMALCMVLALCACGAKTEAPAADAPAADAPAAAAPAAGSSLNFTTGGDQGTYYGFGGVMAQKTGEVSDTKVTAITSGGSQANIYALQDGDAQLDAAYTEIFKLIN